MSFEDATAALGNAIEADAGPEPVVHTPHVPAPVEQAPVAPTTPEGETTPVQVQPGPPRDEHGRFAARPLEEPTAPAVAEPAQDTFDAGQFNPDTLPPELQPGWKQLQAAYTQKTQELAEQRRQLEGIDPAQAQEAIQLYQALQDPNYLREFYTELSEVLGEGTSTTEAAPAPEANPAVSDTLAALKADPELAPVAEQLSQLQAELQSMKDAQAAEREAAELANWQMAMAGEIQRQEAVLIKDGLDEKKHLPYVHDIAGAYEGNLLEAANVFQRIRQEAISEYLNGKQVVEPGVAPAPGASQTSEVPTTPQDLDEGLRAALMHAHQAGLTELE
jgi:hypothetical protein